MPKQIRFFSKITELYISRGGSPWPARPPPKTCSLKNLEYNGRLFFNEVWMPSSHRNFLISDLNDPKSDRFFDHLSSNRTKGSA